MKRIFFPLMLALGVVFMAFFLLDEKIQLPQRSEVIGGVNLVAPPHPIVYSDFEPLKSLGAGWVAVIPYAFSREGEPHVGFDYPRQWWGEKRAGVITQVVYAKEAGLKVMLKPHVWVRGQGWAGDFRLSSNVEWQLWEKDYANYILSYAKLADSLQIEIFCIGTEYRKAVEERPEFWFELIYEVKSIYGGQLTYAANWDNYGNIPFWQELDLVGVDAYFPLSLGATPGSDQVVQAWQAIKPGLKELSEQTGKLVLFTEFGFRSRDYPTLGHWQVNADTLSVNLEAQAQAYQGTFEAFWPEPWFAGGFLWKWYPEYARFGGSVCDRFTPQRKPAEAVITARFHELNHAR